MGRSEAVRNAAWDNENTPEAPELILQHVLLDQNPGSCRAVSLPTQHCPSGPGHHHHSYLGYDSPMFTLPSVPTSLSLQLACRATR